MRIGRLNPTRMEHLGRWGTTSVSPQMAVAKGTPAKELSFPGQGCETALKSWQKNLYFKTNW